MKTILLALLLLFTAIDSYALTLKETIETAFDNNPITEANDLRLEALGWDVKGVKLDRLPSGYISFSQGLSYYRSTFGGEIMSSNSANTDMSLGMSVRLYDGGAGKNRVCVAEKNYEALKATNNSTNALIPDTLGSLASSVFENYVLLSSLDMEVNFFRQQMKLQEILLKYAPNEDQKNAVISNLKGSQKGIDGKLYQAALAITSYEEELVNVPLSGLMDNLDVVARQIIVPESAEKAIEIGLTKNPEIQIANSYLEATRCSLKAQKADSSSWKLDMNASVGASHFNGQQDSSSAGNTIGLTLSKPLSPSRGAYMTASSLRVQAIEKDLDKEIRRLKTSLSGNLYPQMLHYEKDVEYYRQRIIDNNNEAMVLIKKLENHEPVDFQTAREMVGQGYDFHWQYIDNLKSYITVKFNIQKKIGILFDEIHADKDKPNYSPR